MARRSYGTGSLIVRTDRNGRETWHGKWRGNGRQVMRALGPKRAQGERDGLTKLQAEDRLRELIATTLTGAENGRTAVTVKRLHEAYTADRGRRLKSTTLTDYAAIERNHLTPFFGARSVESIAATDVDAFVSRLIKRKLAAKSIDNYVVYLASLLNYAVDREWIAKNPARGVTLPESPDDVDELRFLEVHEVHDLIAHARPGLYEHLDRALYAIASMGGLRQGECLGLLWRAVDFGAGRVRIEENVVRAKRTTPKSRQRRSVPLAPRVAEELTALREQSRWVRPTDPVFADPVTGRPLARTPLMERYRDSLEAAGIESFRFHDLRHTFGTTMARSGVDVVTIQAWMGHSDLATTKRYMHYAPAHGEADRIAAAFARADPRYQSATNMSESAPTSVPALVPEGT